MITQPVAKTRRSGFSFLEMTIATSLSLLILGAVLSTFTVAQRSFMAVSNYGIIHRQGRNAVDIFSKDFRKATDVTSYSTSSVTLKVPTGYNDSGQLLGFQSIRYTWQNPNFIRTNLTTNQSQTLCTNVYSATFSMYDRLGKSTTLPSLSKGLQVELRLRRTVIGTNQTEDFLSARLVMRNKQ